jgi:hypothetical protein
MDSGITGKVHPTSVGAFRPDVILQKWQKSTVYENRKQISLSSTELRQP